MLPGSIFMIENCFERVSAEENILNFSHETNFLKIMISHKNAALYLVVL